ncbi:MAG: histidine kinase [Methanobacteriales archaeon HGW-Methanobacteriales-1]|nr:MAG: histidine kinase [Methanobacteriales archaeon HGW-Methanobacteriales-1]
MAGAKILLVEDESITADDISEGLVELGYDVLAAVSTGEEAIKKAEDLSPDIIIMDIRLKGKMDGIEAAQEIRRRFGIPIIYLTAYSDESTVERAKITEPSGYILKGDSSFLSKPFDDSDLHTAIEITLYKHKMELRLIKNQQQMDNILRNVSDAIISTDSKRQVRLINSNAEDITGWLKEDAIGMDLMTVLDPISGQLGLLDTEDISMARPLEFSDELIRTKLGEKIKISGTLNPSKDLNGKIDGWVIVFNDL